MLTIKCRTKFENSGDRKNKVFFSCHPEDFPLFFNKICEDIFRTHDFAIYYFENPDQSIPDDELDETLGQMELLVVPVTKKTLFDRGATMNIHIPYAREKGIPILPIVMENEIDNAFLEKYSKDESFGEMQYISPTLSLKYAIAYEDKLRSTLDSLFIDDDLKDRIREAFDAYIFLSYRKKDRKYASELMRIIHEFKEFRDIAIWYDEYLTPGESFRQNIDNALKSSNIMALLVTPSILEEPDGKPNFVMGEEYPRAIELGKRIVPAEMESIDRLELCEKFASIPECVDPSDKEALKERLIDALYDIAIRENDEDPEHNFLIGLAYLEGIDVEVNRERGERLIHSAAYAGVPEAIIKFYNILNNNSSLLFRGNTQEERRSEMVSLAKRLQDIYTEKYGETDIRTLDAMYMAVSVLRSPYRYRDLCKLCEDTYGKEHPKTIEYYAALIKYCPKKEAIDIGEEMYPICVKVLGEDNSIAFTYLSYMSEAYFELWASGFGLDIHPEMNDKWHATVELAYRCKERYLGRLHPQTIEALRDSLPACPYEECGRRIADYYIREAEAAGQSALEGAREAAKKWTWSDNASQRREEAKAIYEVFRREKGEDDEETLSFLSDYLADAYCDLKDTQNELKIREYLCSVYKSKGEKYKNQADISMLASARIHSELGNYQRAFDIITAAVGKAEYEKISKFIIDMLKYDVDRAACLLGIGNALIVCGDGEVGLQFVDGMLEMLFANFEEKSDLALDGLTHLHASYLLAGKEARGKDIIESKICALCARPREDFVVHSLWGATYDKGYKIFNKVYGIAKDILGEDNEATKLSFDALAYFLENICDYMIKTKNDTIHLPKYAEEFYALKESRIPAEYREAVKSVFNLAKKCLDTFKMVMSERSYHTTAYGGFILHDSQNEGHATEIYRRGIELTNLIISGGDTTYYVKDGIMYSHFEGNFFGYKNTTAIIRYFDDEGKEDFTLPDSVDTINAYAFGGADKLVSITLGENLRRIDGYAFAGCTALKEVHLTKGIESFGESPFMGCPNIERIVFDGTLAEWSEVSQVTPYDSYRYIPVQCLDKDSFLTSE